jgi:hypothetical protein
MIINLPSGNLPPNAFGVKYFSGAKVRDQKIHATHRAGKDEKPGANVRRRAMPRAQSPPGSQRSPDKPAALAAGISERSLDKRSAVQRL